MRHDPIALYRHALRCRDFPLVDALTRAFRRDAVLAWRADAVLQLAPREPVERPVLRAARAFERVRALLDPR
ncbi:MAG: hypothetical protein M3433_03310 [Actinomycetota bacterium]|nr:hypothetical protein [Actinomycetota bacterium]